MKRFFTICFLILSFCSYAQKNEKHQFVSKSGYLINEGDEVELGIPILADGNFKFIYYNGSTLEGWGDTKTKPDIRGLRNRTLSKKDAFQKVRIDKIKNGKLYFKKHSVGFYVIIAEAAIQTGELIIPNIKPAQEKDKPETTSVADEISKLKKLYDEGVITKEEFESQKKKLLDK